MNDGAGGETGGSRRKSKDDESRIPVPNSRVFWRSASLRLHGERSSPRSFPEPIAEGGQSCMKIWPGRPSCRYRSQVTWVTFSSPFHHSIIEIFVTLNFANESKSSFRVCGALGQCSVPGPRTLKNVVGYGRVLDSLLFTGTSVDREWKTYYFCCT